MAVIQLIHHIPLTNESALPIIGLPGRPAARHGTAGNLGLMETAA
jgi:hypothetical protein